MSRPQSHVSILSTKHRRYRLGDHHFLIRQADGNSTFTSRGSQPAIAIAQRKGPQRGLDEIHEIQDSERLAKYPFYHLRWANLRLASAILMTLASILLLHSDWHAIHGAEFLRAQDWCVQMSSKRTFEMPARL